jgi:hypothetical protein
MQIVEKTKRRTIRPFINFQKTSEGRTRLFIHRPFLEAAGFKIGDLVNLETSGRKFLVKRASGDKTIYQIKQYYYDPSLGHGIILFKSRGVTPSKTYNATATKGQISIPIHYHK